MLHLQITSKRCVFVAGNWGELVGSFFTIFCSLPLPLCPPDKNIHLICLNDYNDGPTCSFWNMCYDLLLLDILSSVLWDYVFSRNLLLSMLPLCSSII